MHSECIQVWLYYGRIWDPTNTWSQEAVEVDFNLVGLTSAKQP